MQKNKIIGIDLGTTNSCVAVIEGGKPVVIANTEGGRTTPSIVAFDKDLNRLIGLPAKRQSIQNPERTFRSAKRHMGTNFRMQVDHLEFSPEQISASILQKLKLQAQAYLGEKVTKAIITVPAYFDDAQRLATRRAGEIAGLEVVRIMNEPTACALAYGFNKTEKSTNVVIFDFGGGTFDTTILVIDEGVLQVKSTNGNNKLGGDDFDERIIKWIADKCKELHGVDVTPDPVAMQRLLEAAENAKIELSGVGSASIQLPFLSYAEGQPVNLDLELTQAEFNEFSKDLVEATAKPIEAALRDAKLKAEEVENVVLVGGTTRLPAVQQFIRKYFNREPVKSVNPDEAVAIGAAIQGGILSGEVQEVLLLDVVPITLGIEDPDGNFVRIVPRNSTIPLNKTHTFNTYRDNQDIVSVHVLQGEEDLAGKNTSLATFDVTNIPPAPAGEQQITLTFDIDADGIFHCKATHAGSLNIDEHLVIKRTTGIQENEMAKFKQIEKQMVDREEEKFNRIAVLALVEKSIAELDRFLKSGTLPAEQEKAYRDKLDQVRGVIGSADAAKLEAMHAKIEELLKKLTVTAAS
ncbi:MAG: molecular chaperone DnaK [Candidatus Obscuribacterales bacterium]|nr:molecular chaperone DnaK [Candidatus Obscuribacterales bacterium]